jgi:hypothetical protein
MTLMSLLHISPLDISPVHTHLPPTCGACTSGTSTEWIEYTSAQSYHFPVALAKNEWV